PRFSVVPLLRAHAEQGQLHGLRHHGRWTDVGTPQRLAELDEVLGMGNRESGMGKAEVP
ncbi:nucleotidyltransferase family protein, partial [Pantoea dispersa]